MTYTGWAIQGRTRILNKVQEMGWCGRYFFADHIVVPDYLDGHISAIFRTRAAARAALPKPWVASGKNHWYVPVKVRVTVEVVK